MARATRLDLNQVLESLQQNGATGGLELRRSESNSEIAYAPLFETARSRVRLYWLRPGQRIPAHTHSFVDDIFYCIRGSGRIRTWDSGGTAQEHAIEPGTVFLVEPETPHEVSCRGDEFCFVILQAPRERYDFVAHKTATT